MQPVFHEAWYRLDNAANIFPAVSGEKNTNVFRLSCELRETIDRDLLQQAVDIAMKGFPYFQVVMRRGLFWFYLEQTTQTPKVEVENQRPCSALFYKGIKSLLFRVSCFRKRINLEVFHAVADGGGALELLRSIVYHYLVLVHREELPENLPNPPGETAPDQKAEDSFDRYYTPAQKDSVFRRRAYTIGGTPLPPGNIKVIEARVPTRAFLTLAKSKGTTITAYLATLMLLSIYHQLMPRRAASRTISVTVPVDLRGHFASHSSRNFFSVVSVDYNFSKEPDDLEAVLESVNRQLKEATQSEALAGRINYTMGVQKNPATRFTPLILKNIILRGAYHKAEASNTCALSNMGRITMPECFDPYIDRFTCMLNPTAQHRLKLALCSYQDALTLSFTSCIAETGAHTWIIRHLTENGLEVTLTCNGGYDDEIL